MIINPILKNETKRGLRTMRSPWTIFIYNLILVGISLAVFYNMTGELRYSGTAVYSGMIKLYMIMAYVEFAMLALILPILTAGSIAGERERQTLDMLLITRISPWKIIMGKLEASISAIVILAISGSPAFSMVFVYGGIGFFDLFCLMLFLIVFAVFIGSIGIFYSTILKRTVTATVMTYLTMIGIFLGTYLFLKGIYHLQYLEAMRQMTYVEPDIHWLIYLSLINPITSFIGLINHQTGNNQIMIDICNRFGSYSNDFVVANWFIISILVQSLVAGALLKIASWKLNPLK